MLKEKKDFSPNPLDIENQGNELILFNDDINTFDYVIESLMEVCSHSAEQAEQCAIIAHTNGKCAVKKGEMSELQAFHDEMKRRGLITQIS